MRLPYWLRFWSAAAWREWWERKRVWRVWKRRPGGPRPPRPLSPVWLPALALLLIVSIPSQTPPDTAVLTLDRPAPSTTTTVTDTTSSSTTTTVTGTTSSSTITEASTTTTDGVVSIFDPPRAGPSGDPEKPAPPGAMVATVVEVVDGDTVVVSLGSGRERVRLIGINSPESGECYAAEAEGVLEALTPVGAEVALTSDVSDRDDFDRLLRYLWVGGMSVNEELVRRGVAIARRYPPDTEQSVRFESAQREAAEAGRGMWAEAACGPGAEASLRIVELRFDAPGDDNQNLNEEWIRIRNDGDAVADLTGWVLKDESASHRFHFPEGFTLAPGESVTVHTGCGIDFGTTLYWCQSFSAVWNNSGDTAFLLDPNGNVHTQYGY